MGYDATWTDLSLRLTHNLALNAAPEALEAASCLLGNIRRIDLADNNKQAFEIKISSKQPLPVNYTGLVNYDNIRDAITLLENATARQIRRFYGSPGKQGPKGRPTKGEAGGFTIQRQFIEQLSTWNYYEYCQPIVLRQTAPKKEILQLKDLHSLYLDGKMVAYASTKDQQNMSKNLKSYNAYMSNHVVESKGKRQSTSLCRIFPNENWQQGGTHVFATYQANKEDLTIDGSPVVIKKFKQLFVDLLQSKWTSNLRALELPQGWIQNRDMWNMWHLAVNVALSTPDEQSCKGIIYNISRKNYLDIMKALTECELARHFFQPVPVMLRLHRKAGEIEAIVLDQLRRECIPVLCMGQGAFAVTDIPHFADLLVEAMRDAFNVVLDCDLHPRIS